MSQGLPFTPAAVSARDERLVSVARALLTAVPDCDDAERAELKLQRFLDRAARSPAHTDAAFAAAQALRDLDVLEPCEAAHVFLSLYEVWQDEIEEHDVSIQALRATFSERDMLTSLAGLARRGAELQAEFYRARGEHALAVMMLDQPEAHMELLTDGSMMLIEDKIAPNIGISFEADPRLTALVAERLIALSATEEVREAYPAWRSFCAAQDIDNPVSTVAAVRSLRELGVITFEESAGLIDEVAGTLTWSHMETDRQCVRWQRKMAAIEAANGPIVEGAEPVEYRALQQLVKRRCDGTQATYLRRLGEHELANLLIEDPAEYERIRDGALPGAWGRR